MIATLCCDIDAFVIKTDEELQEVLDNLHDEDEDFKYTVVRAEDAHLLCNCYDTAPEQVNCMSVRQLQSLTEDGI